MKRTDLEHIIRAAAAITNQYEFVIIGSQSILGEAPNAPEELCFSMEADIYALVDPSASDLIDGSIGEYSPFHERFGYYAQGVSSETAKLPAGWESRLVKVQNANTDLKIGYCLELHDLAASKLAAGREKDFEFVKAMFDHKMIDTETLQQRVASLDVDEKIKYICKGWIDQQTRRTKRSTP